MKLISELRQDLVSGDWVVVATGRAKRPQEFSEHRPQLFRQPKASCPFEKTHKDAVSLYSLDGRSGKTNWWVEVIPNKYPAFGQGVCNFFHKVGPHQWTEGVGVHEVVVTQDHQRSFAEMSHEEVELVIRAYQDRFLSLQNHDCVEYVSIFHNHGRQAGASISHPHSQIIAIPVIPPDVDRSLKGSARYFHEHKSCIHCLLLRYEMRTRDRLVYENDFFAALAPFASKTAFELRIFPKKHSAHFEMILSKERLALANILKVSLSKLFKGLRRPDYNFFLHTAPVRAANEFEHYHWHLEILPKTATWAGFEIGTGIEISTIAPETAAAFLRKIKA